MGEITVNPSEAEIALLEERKRRRAAALAGGTGKGATKDGYPVALLANIGMADDAARRKQPVEGVGLFRTEFLFSTATRCRRWKKDRDLHARFSRRSANPRRIVRSAPWTPAPTSR
ncbi:MAG: hypothetical protein QM736_21970 [Vicinamibacterales bacterium]